jgi:hypothetical protein
MSVDHNGYIGPYIRVFETFEEKKVDYCATHNFPDTASFCPQCGSSKSQRYGNNRASVTAPDDWQGDYKKNSEEADFSDYLQQVMIIDTDKSTEISLFIPNGSYKELNIPRVDGGKYSIEEVPFDDLDIPGSIEKFKKLFADEIAYLEQWFKIEIKYGYLGYCS